MSLSYEDIEKEWLKKLQSNQSDYEQNRKQYATDYESKMNSAIDQSAQTVLNNLESEKQSIPAQYKKQYDINAVQELVNRRQLGETMARMGLTDSGLNRTQQTAITLQKGNADASVRAAEQEAARKLQQAIDEAIANREAQKLQNSASIWGQANSDILNNRTSLYNSAMQNATSQYNAALEAEQSAAKLATEQAQAQAKAEQQKLENAMSIAKFMQDSGASYSSIIGFLQSSGVLGSGSSSGSDSSSVTESGSTSNNSLRRYDTNGRPLDKNGKLLENPNIAADQIKNWLSAGLINAEEAVDIIIDKFDGWDEYIEMAAKRAGLYDVLQKRLIQ